MKRGNYVLEIGGTEIPFSVLPDFRVSTVASMNMTKKGRLAYDALAVGEYAEIECERPTHKEIVLPDISKQETHIRLSCACRIGTVCKCAPVNLPAPSARVEIHVVNEAVPVLIKKLDSRFCGTASNSKIKIRATEA